MLPNTGPWWTGGFLSLFSLINLSDAGSVSPPQSPPLPSTSILASITAGATPLRILPLGDSITYGYNDRTGNSYRRDLACLLWTSGNPVAMIGSVRNGDWENNESDAFIYHTIDEIREAAAPELTREADAERPNVILLHAGTVNFVLGKNVTSAPERLGGFLDFITEGDPGAVVVVAKLIPNTKEKGRVQALIEQYNEEMPKVVAQNARKGKKVFLTSMEGVTADMVPDHSHPNKVGSRIMAQRFFEAVVEAGRRGLIVPAKGAFTDRGASSVPPSGNCKDLVGGGEGNTGVHGEL